MDISTKIEAKLSKRLRLASMLLDHFIICFIFIPLLFVISLIFKSDNQFETSPIDSLGFYLMILVYFNKDIISGRSVAKRILGLRIIDRKTELPANELKCLLRNITIPLWPLEVLISLISPTRRLGDMIANTRLEKIEKEQSASILHDIKETKITGFTLTALLLGGFYVGLIWCFTEYLLNV